MPFRRFGHLFMFDERPDHPAVREAAAQDQDADDDQDNRSRFHAPFSFPFPVPDRILSGTGAGDTSIAAFLTAMLSGEDPEMCLHLAAAAGASCVAAYDALGGLCSLEELKERIEAGWEKYPEN